ncbi:putative cytosine deaminase [Cyphellophora attinorum]|uniref:Putative cytosine deaminase n=1 Tax=Cyphellophora attinorum TaxID=1664694 RepID=A0A0N1H4Q5_9EURO|nr:putative cytosine deaminase [Phialophora attinorum]KPI36392.1 putative cytosine deaminase [Phialophora attinorum]
MQQSHRLPLTTDQIDAAFQTCLKVQDEATTHHNKRPFAAVLLGPDNTSILLSHFSISHYQHAESELARLAAIHYAEEFLGKCTLVSTWEPCAMCTGTTYWVGVGRILYAASEGSLGRLTGDDNGENMTMALPCRTVVDAGQKDIEVIGPVAKWEEEVLRHSDAWWKAHTTS